MMTKTTSRKTAFFKKAAMVIVFSVAFYMFSGKTIAGDIDNLPAIPIFSTNLMDEIVIPNSGVSQEQIDEYKKITEKYEYCRPNGKMFVSSSFTPEDLKTLYATYVQMTVEQRMGNDLHVFFGSPLISEPRRAPKKNEWGACKSSNNKRIWVDDKEVSQEEVNKYDRLNIAYFVLRMESEDYDKQSFMWTKQGLENYKKKYEKGIPISELMKIPPYRGVIVGFDKPQIN